MAATTKELRIRIAADTRQVNEQLKKLSDQFKNIDVSGKSAADSTDKLKNKLASMGQIGASVYAVTAAFNALGMSISGIARAADSWAVVNAKMKLAAGASADFGAIQTRVFNMAQQAGARYADLGDVYAKVAKGAESLGLSQERVLGVTQTVANTLRMMGGSSASASAALTQFGQSLASGQLRGEELNSVLEQMPPLAEAIAKGLGKTTGDLRKLAEDGKLSVGQLVLALEHSALEVERSAAKMPRTFSGSMAVLGNETDKFIGKINEAIGASSAFQSVVGAMVSHLNVLAMTAGTLLALALGKAAGAIAAKTASTYAGIVASRAAAIAEAQLAVSAAGARVSMIGNTAALVAAQGALARLTGAAYMASTAMSALGGPIGIITGLLAVGATAWTIWGDNAESAADKAKRGAENSAANVRRILEEQRKGAKYGIGNEGVLREEAERLDAEVKRKQSLLDRGISERAKTGGDTTFTNLRASLAADRVALAEINKGIRYELDKKKDYDNQMKLALGKPDKYAAKAAKSDARELQTRLKAENDIDFAHAAGAFDQEAIEEQRARDSIKKASNLDADVASDLVKVAQESLGDAYSARFYAINKQWQEYIKRFESVRAELDKTTGSTAAGDNLLSDINTWSTASYSQATVDGASENVDKAEEERKQRLATLQAEVTAGIKTQSEAQREGIAISRDAMSAMQPHMDHLQDLAKTGFPPAIAAMQKYQAIMTELKDQVSDKTWLDGIRQGLKDISGAANDSFRTARDAVTNAFKGMEDAIVSFVKTGKLDFKSLANSIISDLIRIQVQEMMTKSLKPLMGMAMGAIGGMFGGYGSAFAGTTYGTNFGSEQSQMLASQTFAKGGAFNSDSLHRHVNSIVTKPTYFAFARGGVMGEAGPEAIMPLARGPDGNLGVRMNGTGGGDSIVVNQTINIDATGADASTVARIQSAVNNLASNLRPAAVAAVREAMLKNRRSPSF